MGLNLAVVGATGVVGNEILSILAKSKLAISKISALASGNSEGKEVYFGEDRILKVSNLEDFNFSDTDIAFFTAGSDVSNLYAPIAAKQKCLVIDNTSRFRMDHDIPLIIPEVNSYAIKDYKKKYIISNPNCSTIQMLVALKPLHDLVNINRVVVSTYQSVSGAGRNAMNELHDQNRKSIINEKFVPKNFTKNIVHNVIPHIDDFLLNGSTKEEQKMVNETKKILDDSIKVSATCVRVPTYIGHAESLNIEFKGKFDFKIMKKALREGDGIKLIDGDKYITPEECAGKDYVYISRVRVDETIKNGINMWVVSDNLRKGAALNSVQIAELLIKKYLV